MIFWSVLARIISKGKNLSQIFKNQLFKVGILKYFLFTGSIQDISISLTPAETIPKDFVKVVILIKKEI